MISLDDRVVVHKLHTILHELSQIHGQNLYNDGHALLFIPVDRLMNSTVSHLHRYGLEASNEKA